MSETKPQIRWHELLKGRLDSQVGDPDQDLKSKYEKGIQIHRQIQRWFPKFSAEDGFEKNYLEDGLPFEISYHVDILDSNTKTVYEIKPLIWWIKNQHYSRLQASGYWHFTEAERAFFILYALNHDDERSLAYVCLLPVEKVPWIQLRELVLSNYDAILRIQGGECAEERS
jgi:hypothetical protein